jgi:hypothetical protein
MPAIPAGPPGVPWATRPTRESCGNDQIPMTNDQERIRRCQGTSTGRPLSLPGLVIGNWPLVITSRLFANPS